MLAECRFSSQNIRTLISIWQSAKISKYRQNIKIKFRFKIAKYRLYRRRFWRSRRHFSAFFKLYQKKKAENASELQKSHKTFAPKIWKFSKIRQNVLYFDILAVCSILIFYWYFVLVFWNLRKSAASFGKRPHVIDDNVVEAAVVSQPEAPHSVEEDIDRQLEALGLGVDFWGELIVS